MQRLDDVCGPENWRNEFRYEQNGAVLCGISIFTRIPDREPQWITKWDGAENTDIEAVKGGLSNSMKRAAVQWGIGRYLYDLEEGWAEITDNGAHFTPAKPDSGNKKGYPAFRWNPPNLPSWAMPNFTGTAAAKQADKPKRDPATTAIDKAKTVVVRDKTLADYTTAELVTMEAKIRAEGGSKHRDLLGSIILVLTERPIEDVNVARMQVKEDQHQAGLQLAGAG
jgi:hypothetical protein